MILNSSKQKKKESGLIWYTILFAIIGCLSFSSFIFLGKTFIYDVDAVYQHYPLLVNLRHMVGAFLRGDGFPFWSENIGLGSDTLGNLAIVLLDPFNYIAAAFPVKYIDVGYSVAVVLRMYAAGVAMLAFLKYHDVSNKNCIVGGISYAFCSWAVGVIRHGFFLLPLIFFPLVILGIDKVFDGKRPYILIFSVFASLVTYLYFSYMTAIFCFIYIVVRYWNGGIEEKRSVKKFWKLIGKFLGYVMIAVCMASPVIFSTMFTLLNAGKTSGVDISFTLSLKEMLRFLPSFVSEMEVTGNYSYMGVNVLATFVVPILPLRLQKKKEKIPMILFYFCAVMMLFPYWGSLMNGFSYSVGRWCYILSFFSVWSMVLCFEQKKELSIIEKRAVAVWAVIVGSALIVGGVFTNALSSANIAEGLCSLLFVALLLTNYVKIINKYIYIVVTVCISVSYVIHFSPFEGNDVSNYLEIGKVNAIYQQSLARAEKKIKDKDYWRFDYIEHMTTGGDISDIMGTPLNENLYWGGRTLSTYLSSLDANLLSYNKSLGNNGGYFRRMCVFSNDNRSRLNFLQGVKYYLRNIENENAASYAGYGYEEYKKTDDAVILKNKYDAGLGYVFPYVMKESEFEKYDALEKEQVLMQTVIVPDKEISELGISECDLGALKVDMEEIAYAVADSSELAVNGSFQVERSGQKMVISIPKYENVEVYIQFEELEKEPYTVSELRAIEYSDREVTKYEKVKFDMGYMSYHPYKNFEYYVEKDKIRKRVLYAAGEAQGLTDQNTFLLNLGYFDEIEGDISITFNTLGKYSYDSLKVFAVPQDNFDDQAQKLVDNRFQMTSQSANKITGTVSAQQDGMLYLSILYHPGWEIYVDGKKTDTYRTDICFTGVPVKQGAHTVELVYRPVGFELSLMLFAMGVMAVISIVFYYKKKEKK